MLGDKELYNLVFLLRPGRQRTLAVAEVKREVGANFEEVKWREDK